MMKIKLLVKATFLSYEAVYPLIITEQYSQRNVILADLKQFAIITKIKPQYNKPWPKVHADLAVEELCCDIKYMQHMEMQED